MNYQKFCEEFNTKSTSVQGNEIHVDAKVIRDYVNRYPNFAERWFNDALKIVANSSDPEQALGVIYGHLALVATILKSEHGIDGPASHFKK